MAIAATYVHRANLHHTIVQLNVPPRVKTSTVEVFRPGEMITLEKIFKFAGFCEEAVLKLSVWKGGRIVARDRTEMVFIYKVGVGEAAKAFLEGVSREDGVGKGKAQSTLCKRRDSPIIRVQSLVFLSVSNLCTVLVGDIVIWNGMHNPNVLAFLNRTKVTLRHDIVKCDET